MYLVHSIVGESNLYSAIWKSLSPGFSPLVLLGDDFYGKVFAAIGFPIIFILVCSLKFDKTVAHAREQMG